MKLLYSAIEPYKTEYFKVSNTHSLYLEQSGNPKGIPILELHGGPGAKSKPDHRRYYNPKKYRIIFFDQRGCGKSKPAGETKENTTWNLVEDIEKIRKHLGIEKWIVNGGSWGSTLALAYAESHPKGVQRLILRSIFLCRKWELKELFNSDRFSVVYPDVWEEFVGFIPKQERKNLAKAYEKRIFGRDKKLQEKATQLLYLWDTVRQYLVPPVEKLNDIKVTGESINGWKIFFHYMKHNMFLKENQLIKNIDKIRKIPGAIFHGRYDMICPLQNAWDLHKAWPEAQFNIIPDASHKLSEPGTREKVMEYLERLRR